MIDERLVKLLSVLSQEHYLTAENLAEMMGTSSKTVRNRLKELEPILRQHGADIVSKHGSGYKLRVEDVDQFKEIFLQEDAEIFDTSQKRVRFLLGYFLNTDEYVKMEDLSDMLCVCKKTLAADVKEVEKIFERYEISMDRKPYKGMKIAGDEFHLRLCMAEYGNRKQEALGATENEERKNLNLIAESLAECFEITGYQISDVALKSLAMHIYIAAMRIKEKNYVPGDFSHYEKWLKGEEIELAKRCAASLGEALKIEFPESEIYYIAIHLAGKRESDIADNIIISSEITEIVNEMLDEVYRVLRIDFRNDLELIMSLGKHMEALLIRIQFGLKMKNPVLKDIREKFCMAYSISMIACVVITKRYGKPLEPDEIGYIALGFALAIERQHAAVEKKSLLLVCSSGLGTAKLMSYKVKELFGDYIKKLQTCELRGLEKMDFSEIDYIFTTVPIPITVPVPICEVQYFMGTGEVNSLKMMLKSDARCNVIQYYPPELFFTEVKAENKEQVLRYLCLKIAKQKDLPEDFIDSVLEREGLAQTAFGNNVAMPHPCYAMTKDTFVCVAILDKPIEWCSGQLVRAVFLVSIAMNPDNRNKDFYRITSRLLLNKQYIQELIKDNSYSKLAEELSLIENNLEEEQIV